MTMTGWHYAAGRADHFRSAGEQRIETKERKPPVVGERFSQAQFDIYKFTHASENILALCMNKYVHADDVNEWNKALYKSRSDSRKFCVDQPALSRSVSTVTFGQIFESDGRFWG